MADKFNHSKESSYENNRSRSNVAGIIVDQETAESQTLAAQLEIEEISGSAHNFQTHTITVELNGKMIQVEVPIDDIDLLDDFDDEDLTEEGERSLGVISEDFDTTAGTSAEKKSRNRMLKGKVSTIIKQKYNTLEDKMEDYEDYLITCPYTGSTDVYKVSSNVFASYETDQQFIVNFEEKDEED